MSIRKWTRWTIPFLMLAASAVAANAQVFDVPDSAAGSPIAVTAPWRYHAGDDRDGKLGWMLPEFDDAQWPTAALNQAPETGTEAGRWIWYRLRLRLPAASGAKLAFGFGALFEGAEVYVDGRLAATYGHLRPSPKPVYLRLNEVLPLPESAKGHEVEVAIRTWHSALLSDVHLNRRTPPMRIGDRQTLEMEEQLADRATLVRGLPNLLMNTIALCIGIFSLGLFLLRRRAREYLWGAIWLLTGSAVEIAGVYAPYSDWNSNYYRLFVEGLSAVSDFSYVFFVWRFLGEKNDILLRIGATAAVLEFLNVLLYQMNAISLSVNFINVSVLSLAITIVVSIRLILSGVRGSRIAWLLFLPFLPDFTLSILRTVNSALQAAGVSTDYRQPMLINSAAVQFSMEHAFELAAYLAVAALIGLRFTRSAERAERLQTEMETARQVQEQLVPHDLPATRNFRFEAAYLAASEVGGDLYQVFPQADGGVIVAIGDVSGKGLKAAMLGTLVVGALRTLTQQELSPARILERLNQQLAASPTGGFVTCQVLRISQDGAGVMSNAGHLAPYCGGQEMECDSGFPLGVAAGIRYEETRFKLQSGDVMTLLSDGVVEAMNQAGELMGFEKTREISMRSAAEIAEEARRYGQQDDITVLTIAYAGAIGDC